jgi:transposase-like protein
MRNRPICKKCESKEVVKNGHNRCGTQRYKCKECGAVFVWKYKKEQRLPRHRDKRKILDCYAEGMGMRAIARVFKVSTNTIKKWIEAEGKEFKQPDLSKEEEVECDEMWAFVQKKEKKSGYGSVYQK